MGVVQARMSPRWCMSRLGGDGMWCLSPGMVSEVWYGWSPEPRAVVLLVDRRDLRCGEIAVGWGLRWAGGGSR